MKRIFSKIYPMTLLVMFLAGQIVVLCCAWTNLNCLIESVIGFAVGCILAPMLHELGHFSFGSANGMALKYIKFFCFRWVEENGKMRFSFESPFESEETQMVATYGGDMKKRAANYTVGGVVFGGVYTLVLLAFALLLNETAGMFVFVGALPYAAYLFLLNVAPFEYVSGKTDILVLNGILKDADAEKTMLAAMEIQGQVYQGKTFSEVDETLYFDLPQLCEDEPLYAIMLDLRYRYYLDKGDLDGAVDALNRLAVSSEYLTNNQAQQVAAQFVYVNSILGNQTDADKSGKLCQEFLMSENVQAKRILAAYAAAFGVKEKVDILIEQAKELLLAEKSKGEVLFEKKLLQKIVSDK